MYFSTIAALVSIPMTVLACSRITYDSGPEDNHRIVVGRTMDWFEKLNSSIWIFPAGLERKGLAGANSLEWTSKYGSVITSAYDLLTCDGMNSEGLVASALYLAGSDYGKRDSSRKGLSIGLWAQYFLDNFATVQDAADALYTEDGKEAFQVATRGVLPGVDTVLHLALTDKSGDNLIMEYPKGKLSVHHSKDYKVMTNEPPFEEQIALDNYWQEMSDLNLPGTSRPADRFVRLAHFSRVAGGAKDEMEALTKTASIMRGISVPFRLWTPNSNPNDAPTYWRSYCDTQTLTYYYESATSPSLLWVSLGDIDLSKKGDVKVLTLNDTWTERFGNVKDKFVKKAAPYAPVEIPDIDEAAEPKDEL